MLDELIGEFEQVDSVWSRQEDELLDLLETLYSELQDSNKISLITQKRLSSQSENWKSLHGQVSKYTKNFEKVPRTQASQKKVKSDLVDLVPAEKVDTVHNEAITQCILQHFYREGNFEVADTLAAEMGGMTEAKWREPFGEIHRLSNALEQRDITPAIEWIEKSKEKLGEGIASKLLFQLHSLTYIELLKGTCWMKALDYARNNISRFSVIFPRDVETLMGALAFGNHLNASPYSKLLDVQLWQEAEEALVSSYCAVLGLPRQSALQLCLNIGTLAWPKISKVMSIMKHRPGVDWNPQEELPVEIETGPDSHFHSIFVCPVLRQQTTEDNPPMMMSCGHVISQEALMRLCKGNINYRIKCPYCPAESVASNTLRIRF